MKFLSLVTFLSLGIAVGGCVLDGDKNEPRISNESGTAVTVYWTGPTGDDVRFETIDAGQVARAGSTTRRVHTETRPVIGSPSRRPAPRAG